MRLAAGGQTVAEPGQPLATQEDVAVWKFLEHLLEMELVSHIVFAGAGLRQQAIVQRAPFRG